MRNLLDVVIVFGIMGGIGASIGLEIPVISRIFHQITGVADTLGLKFAMLAVLLALFGSSVYLGLEKGMKWLSSATVYITLGLFGRNAFVGPTSYLIDSGNQQHRAAGFQLCAHEHLYRPEPGLRLSPELDYFLLGLVVGLYACDGSVRSAHLARAHHPSGHLRAGTVGLCRLYDGVRHHGRLCIVYPENRHCDLAGILETQGQEAAIAAVIGTLPLPQIMLVVYLISCFVFLATTISSSAFILSSMTSRRLTGYEAPARWNRLFVERGVYAVLCGHHGGGRPGDNQAGVCAGRLPADCRSHCTNACHRADGEGKRRPRHNRCADGAAQGRGSAAGLDGGLHRPCKGRHRRTRGILFHPQLLPHSP